MAKPCLRTGNGIQVAKMSHVFLQARSGGPYPSTEAGLGGLPTIIPDIPVCAVFIFLYICFAATNMTIFQLNRRKRHKFVLSAMLFGFSMARIVTLVIRIAWTTRPHNVRLAIAAQIFVNAGVLIVYIVTLLLAQRILRAKQPRIGWHPVVRLACKILYVLIGVAIVMVIVAVVLSSYTLNSRTKSICRDIQLAGITYLLVFTCLPLAHVILAVLLPKSKDEESFGQGGMYSKLIIVALSSCLCVFIAGFKCGATWSPPRPVTDPAWYDSKACLYVFDFTFEILILSLLTFSRIDKRFFVPNGSTRAGDYTRLRAQNDDLGYKGEITSSEAHRS